MPELATRLIVGACLLAMLTTWAVLAWHRRRSRYPAPSADARPGHYVVRWEHRDFCSRCIYEGPDLKRARHLYYQAEGAIRGATIEFWDGPHRRAVRIA